MPDPHVAIIGAGVGGLVAAIDLAVAGLRVTVVEKAEVPGGKLRQTTLAGRGLDVGPTVLTLRDVFDDVFATAGARLDDHLTLTRQTILARHGWPDGSRLDLYADPAQSADAIADFAGPDAARGFAAFCRQASLIYDTLDQAFIRAPRPANPLVLSGRMGWDRMPGLLRIQPYTTLWQALDRTFDDPRLKQLFGRYATYCGSSPFEAPATLMLIAHVEQRGVWKVAGGMVELGRSLERLAVRCGVTFRYGAAVAAIVLRNGRATGLRLRNGDMLTADAVVANCDAAALASGCFGADGARAVPRHGAASRSFSAVTVAASARLSGFPVTHHNVFFSSDSPAEFTALREGRMPERPTVYLCAQDRGDGSAPVDAMAPDRVFAIVNAPARGDTHPFTPSETDACEARIFRQLEACGLKLDRQPGATEVTTPADFARSYPGTGGALYGPASHGWMASFRRPGSRSRVPGLYLAGGSTHPGAGVPMAALSGRLAARSLVSDLASMRRSVRGATIGGTWMPSARTAGKG